MLDLSAAFDVVSHLILYKKLEAYGLLSPNFNQVFGPQNKTKWADFSRMVLPDSKV